MSGFRRYGQVENEREYLHDCVAVNLFATDDDLASGTRGQIMKNQWWHCQTCGTYFRSPVWKTECFRCGGDQPPPLSRYEIVAGVALALTVIAMLWVMG